MNREEHDSAGIAYLSRRAQLRRQGFSQLTAAAPPPVRETPEERRTRAQLTVQDLGGPREALVAALTNPADEEQIMAALLAAGDRTAVEVLMNAQRDNSTTPKLTRAEFRAALAANPHRAVWEKVLTLGVREHGSLEAFCEIMGWTKEELEQRLKNGQPMPSSVRVDKSEEATAATKKKTPRKMGKPRKVDQIQGYEDESRQASAWTLSDNPLPHISRPW